jgi:molybdate-binding protein/DNA-binding transcriptional regulator YhcF (GntR family)
MAESILYRKIAEVFRQDILDGRLKPGDRLPAVRQLAARWDCTPGTIQRAYQELARQGLVSGQAGRGTRVVDRLAGNRTAQPPLRQVALAHRAEGFLLESVSSGYSVEEVDAALRQAMDRWRALERQPLQPEDGTLRFVGSHDLVITWLASHFLEVVPGWALQLRFAGSLGGLIALAEGQADLAGSHLWDEDSDTYNRSFVRKVLPGQRIALVTLAHRRFGLILPAGNSPGIQSLQDLARPGLRFANRQPGSGTRVWIDLALRRAGLQAGQILGFSDEKATHTAVARAVAEGEADVGIGLEAAARSYGLDFILLSHDRYDLVIPSGTMERPPIQTLVNWLGEAETKDVIESLGGYETRETGSIEWVD